MPVYQNISPPGAKEALRADLAAGRVQVLTFTSSSTVKNFLSMLAAENQQELLQLLAGVKIAVIGPITGKTVTDNGLSVDIQPENYTIEDMVAAIVDYYRREPSAGDR